MRKNQYGVGASKSKIFDSGGQQVVYAHMGGATGLYSGDWNRKSDP